MLFLLFVGSMSVHRSAVYAESCYPLPLYWQSPAVRALPSHPGHPNHLGKPAQTCLPHEWQSHRKAHCSETSGISSE